MSYRTLSDTIGHYRTLSDTFREWSNVLTQVPLSDTLGESTLGAIGQALSELSELSELSDTLGQLSDSSRSSLSELSDQGSGPDPRRGRRVKNNPRHVASPL